jgi:hypothetical protein
MRSWPSWLAVLLGAVALLLGIVFNMNANQGDVSTYRYLTLVGPFLIGGAVLLAAGLHALQASYDAWCGCADCSGGCGCCDDGCTCGDCDACRGSGAGAGHDSHDGHDHAH